MTFRESINNLIRGDKPESPTDLVFVFGSLVLCGLWVFATSTHTTIPHIESLLLFLVGCKGVKVLANKAKNLPSVPPNS